MNFERKVLRMVDGQFTVCEVCASLDGLTGPDAQGWQFSPVRKQYFRATHEVPGAATLEDAEAIALMSGWL